MARDENPKRPPSAPGDVEIDAELAARALGIPVARFMAELRRGTVHGLVETGIDEDAGRQRLRLRHRGREARLVFEGAGLSDRRLAGMPGHRTEPVRPGTRLPPSARYRTRPRRRIGPPRCRTTQGNGRRRAASRRPEKASGPVRKMATPDSRAMNAVARQKKAENGR